MHDLVRTLLDRDVEVGGVRYLVRSPTVREALTILASYQGVLAGQEVQREIFFDTLAGWLPDRLVKVFTKGDYPAGRVVAYVFQIVNEGVPDFKRRRASSEEPDSVVQAQEIDWDIVVSEYMATYGVPLMAVLAEPWNSFLLFSARVDTVNARSSLNELLLNAIPYIKNERERSKIVDDMKERAGFKVETPEEKREKALKSQQKQLDILANQFASHPMLSFNPEPMGEA